LPDEDLAHTNAEDNNLLEDNPIFDDDFFKQGNPLEDDNFL